MSVAPPDTENMGVAAAQLEFSRWGWAFRGQHVKDYGIDAHVEPLDGPHQPTGRLLALQIKSGESYFRRDSAGRRWYRGENRHLRYWFGHVLPVLIVMYDPEDSTLYWQHVTEDRVEFTNGNWKILIPVDQVLSADSAAHLREIAFAAQGAREDSVAHSLPLLPPSAAAVLRQAERVAPDGTMRLARLLAQGREQPRLTVESVLAGQPSWLASGNGMFEAAIGAYANEHGHQDLGLEAFSLAADYKSGEAARLYGIAMVLALGRGDVARATGLSRSAEAAGCEGLLLLVARAALADHEDGADVESSRVAGVLAGASTDDSAAEPTLVVLLGEFAAARGDLVEAFRFFEDAGRIDDAVAECDRAITRFGGGKAAHDRLNILARAGRLDEADEFAISLLAGKDLAPEQRVMLWRRLIRNRADQGKWSEVEQMCREALAETPDEGEFSWGLITAQANQGHLEQAWSSYQAIKPEIAWPGIVQLWLKLHHRFGFAEQDIGMALDLVDRWADDPAVGGLVFPVILDLGGQQLPDGRPLLPELSPELLARFQAEIQAYVQRYPNGPVQKFDLQNVDLTQVIRAQLVPHAGSLNQEAKLVRAGKLPLGALAAAANRPYAAMLIENATGALNAITADRAVFAEEVSAAKEAINGEVVVEASTLAVLTLLPERSTGLRSAFSVVRLPRAALVDIDGAFGDVRRHPGSYFSITYDSERDVLVLCEASLAEHQRLYRRISAVDQTARQLVVTDTATTEASPDGHQAWLSAVDLAAERRLPLWSDDVAVRSIAAGKDVASFGTWALRAALIDLGLILETTAEDAEVLAREGIVELPAVTE
jgi:tetratricopeptide (TPR) repeat protein